MARQALSVVSSIMVAVFLTSCGGSGSGPSASNSRLQTVLDRGQLSCGVSGELPGFSFVKADGTYAGLDVEVCRAIAAALFDNPDAVEYRNLNAKERFTALQTGEIDVLSRNTTWTLQRDGSVRMAFAPIVFYDGQGMMVRKDSGIQSLQGLKDRSICTQTGTTNEQNLSDQMRKLKITYKSVVYEDINAAYAAYQQGRCEGVTSDRSQLLSRRTAFPNPDQHVILAEVMSKEPLAPAVADGDPQWHDAVTWIVFALLEAEELGITSQNLDSFTKSTDPVIQRFLGQASSAETEQTDALGVGLGLTNDFTTRIVKHVGNYGEIYNRHLGPTTQLNLPRGLNRPWNQGGLLYSPPFR